MDVALPDEQVRKSIPQEERRWALPHGEFGLDVIALVGTLRYTSHRSIPEIHQALHDRGVSITERTVTHLLQRYEELVALRLSEKPRLRECFKEQGQVKRRHRTRGRFSPLRSKIRRVGDSSSPAESPD